MKFFKTTNFRGLLKHLLFNSASCAFMCDIPSLKIGGTALSQVTELSVPAFTRPLLKTKIVDNEHAKSNFNFPNAALWQCGAPIPTAYGPLLRTRVVRNECITRRTDPGRIGKPKWELELELITDDDGQQRCKLLQNCDAGDSFNVLFENPAQEVDFVLERLGICAETADAQHTLASQNGPEMKEKFAHLPAHCSPRQLLSQFIDIRRAPSRLTLRIFADHAHEPAERRRLLELCSAQGTTEFTRFVRQPNISLVELLCTFPSLKPPLECLIECLPRLLPRHYTLACYLLLSPSSTELNNNIRLRFVYSVLEMPTSSVLLDECGAEKLSGQKRYGACTQWLLQLRPGQTVQIVQKEPSKFRFLSPSFSSMLPSSSSNADDSFYARLILNMPLMMVGPGTGVAPFVAFLQKIRYYSQRMGNCVEYRRAKRILFYASSNLDDEFLFRSELRQMVTDGVLTELVLCESRPLVVEAAATSLSGPGGGGDDASGILQQRHQQQQKRHPPRVYDALRERRAEVAQFLMSALASVGDVADDGGGDVPACAVAAAADDGCPGGLFYACGDVKNMSRELWACLSGILQSEKGLSPAESIKCLNKLREKERLIEDVWS